MKSKRYVALLTSAMLVFSPVSVLASELNSDIGGGQESNNWIVESSDAPTTRDTDVEYAEDSTFTVILPKKINLSSEKRADYSILVKGTVYVEDSVTVNPEDDVLDQDGVNFIMSEINGKRADVIATVTQTDTLWNSSEITFEGTSKTGEIEANTLSLGHWSGNLTFDINYDANGWVHEHTFVNGVCTECGKIEIGNGQEKLANWRYDLDENARTVTLQQYIGNEADVVIPAKYELNGKNYRVVLGNNDTGLVEGYMFNKTAVTSVTINQGVDGSKVSNASNMFSSMPNVTKIDLSGTSFNNLKNASSMFSQCKASVIKKPQGVSKISNIQSMFSSAVNVRELDLSWVDTSNVKIFMHLFSGCNALTKLNMPNFSTSNAASFSYMFTDCSSLQSLDLSGFDFSKVENAVSMFKNCSSLVSLDLSNKNAGNLIDVQSMFEGCSRLNNLNLANFVTGNIDGGVFSPMLNTFKNCSSLSSLDLRGFTSMSSKTLSATFYGCTNLKSVLVTRSKFTSPIENGAYMQNYHTFGGGCGCSSFTYY